MDFQLQTRSYKISANLSLDDYSSEFNDMITII